MALPLPTTLSPSKVAAFKDCALAFRFSAIDRLPEPPSEPASRGTLVHKALEHLLCEPPARRTVAVALGLLDDAWDALHDDPEFAGLGLDDDGVAAFRSDAATLIERYFTLEDPTAITPIGLELMLEAEVDGLRLRGIIDRLELDDHGELIVTDYKSGRAPHENFEQSRLGGVHFYAYLCEQVFGKRPAAVQLLYLGDATRIRFEPTERSTRGLAQRVGAIWKAVERACAQEDFRPRPGKLCDWCSFKSWCPTFGGNPDAARAEVPASLAGQQHLDVRAAVPTG